ncbi:MAG TPA: PAS domain-containing protein [Candidatus Cybelea sp.]|nr:PAS domain-containing protein [Candidatus Cybelea sp.]
MEDHLMALEARLKSKRLRRLLRDWDSWRRGREFPSRADVAPEKLKYILGGIVLLDVLSDPLRFRYRLMGAALAARRGHDLTGKLLDENPDPELRQGLIRLNTLVFETRLPQTHEYRIHSTVTGRSYNYDALNMPLSQDGVNINMIISGSAYIDDEPP